MKLTYKLDGSARTNVVAGGGAPGEQVSKAVWSGNDLVRAGAKASSR